MAGSNIRLGAGALTVFASRSGTTYTTKAQLTGSSVRRLVIGHTLPRGSKARTVTLDGRAVHGYGKSDDEPRRGDHRADDRDGPAHAGGDHPIARLRQPCGRA